MEQQTYWSEGERQAFIKIESFQNRLKKLGIDVKIEGNYPWIYLAYINDKRVVETFRGEHGFTIAFMPIRKNQNFEFTDISEIFKLIRKYVNDIKK
jgi:hypothetical protein